MTYKEDTSKYEADVTIGNDWELNDTVRDVVTMLKVVFKLHCKIEEFKMTKEDYEELEHITNRLRSMVDDGSISKELMLQLINKHLLLNKDVLIFQLFNPVRELFNSEFLEKAKSILNELFNNIILCRDQNIPLPKRLTYCSYREEKYDQIAALVLTGNIDFGEVSRVVNDYPNLRVAEKNHLLQSIVSAAYKISDEPENEKPEFLNKKFHIPDEILEDLKEPEEEPERKRTVPRQTGMDCFDLEPGHIPEIPCKEEPKNIYEELEELFVKQNEHIKVLLISGAGKNDIKPLAILDYKNKTSEAVRGDELNVMLDCLIPNLTKEGLEHFIYVANNVLKMKDFDHE